MLEQRLGRMTRFLICHRRWVLLAWLLPTPLFFYGFTHVNHRLLTIVMTHPEAQSTYVEQALARDFAKQSQFLALLTYHDDRRQFDAKPFTATRHAVQTRLRRIPCIRALTAYEDLPVRSLFVSKDGHTQVTLIEMGVALNDYHGAERCVNQIRRAIRALRADLALPKLEILVSGPPAIDVDIGRLLQRDSRRAEILVALCSLLLLVWMFRSASAAFLPLITAALAVSGSLFVSFCVALKMDLSLYVAVISSMTGLGLGLDYALLYVTRFREERDRGRPAEEAIVIAAQTAGTAILGSGVIVILGFAGLLIPKLRFPQSVGLAGMLTVLFTLATTLTLLPVLLSWWHPTMRWPRWRWFTASHAAVDRFWARYAAGVLRHPVVLLLAGLTVVGLAGPNLLRLRLHNPRHEAVPMTLESRRGIERYIQIAGESQLYRIVGLVAITGKSTWEDPKRQQHLLTVLDQIRKWPEVHLVRSADMMSRIIPLAGFGSGVAARYVSRDKRLVTIDIYGKDGSDAALNRLVGKLRRELPKAFADEPDVRTYVGDKQATFYETQQRIAQALPIVFPVIAGAAFLFMAFFFRSIVIPLKALLLNAFSLLTTFGLLVLVFQDGHGLSLLGYHGAVPGALSVATPIILFGVVFGVSMDYEVFLMTRIREFWRGRTAALAAEGRGDDPAALQEAHRESVREGIARTGGIITNAAAIMVITFAAFISGTVLPMKEMGFALALAVALDATLVRMVLLPAILRLLGRHTWYWPRRRSRS